MSRKPPPTFQCQLCGVTKERRMMRYKDGRVNGSYDKGQKFCSKECGWKGRSWRPINQEGYVCAAGYRKLHQRGGKKLYQHRKFMEEQLGRPLTRHEFVHHKDGDRLNNKLSNLELWYRYQPSGQRVVDKVQFAIEILTSYPDFARQAGYELRPVHISDEPAP